MNEKEGMALVYCSASSSFQKPFPRTNRPVILLFNVNDCFEVNFTLATLSEELSTQNTRTNTSQSQLEQQSMSIANESSLDATSLQTTKKLPKLPIIPSVSILPKSQSNKTMPIEEPLNTQKSNKYEKQHGYWFDVHQTLFSFCFKAHPARCIEQPLVFGRRRQQPGRLRHKKAVRRKQYDHARRIVQP
jgi:hypothetical protein